jgi:chromatin structure-remodeling complex subunit RSC9
METLMEKAIEITELCTGIKWELERDQYKWPEKRHRPNVLNTLWGTHDILDRISKLPIILPDDTLETDEFCHHLQNIKDATLVLRNMCMLPENAVFISSFAKGLLRDFLCIMLNTPKQSRLNELRNDALDIAEEVTKYLPTAIDDPLRVSLYRYINSDDRAHVIRALWAITHFSTELEGVQNNAMTGVSHDQLVHLFSYTLLKPDPELLNGAMDFWYQFTLIPENVTRLVDVVNLKTVFMPRLIALLSYEAQLESNETVLQEEKIAPPPSSIPKVPSELLKELMELSEPERSSKWLRCCFVEDSDCEITQIALWQAYQTRFVNPQQPNSGVLPAAEFIKNVSTTFTNAQAQVVPIPGAVAGSSGPTTRFIIKGIRPLETALTFDKWPYLYCKWITGGNSQSVQHCDRAFSKPEDLRFHVFEDHMSLQPSDQPGHYKLEKASEPIHKCLWDNCPKIKRVGPSADTSMVVEHVASAHLPQPRDPNAQPPTHEREILQPRIVRRWDYWNTPTNPKGEPVGVAYKACLVLRNLAWNLPNEKSEKNGNMSLRKSVFLSRRNAIINAWDINRSLRLALTDLLLITENFDD